MSDLEKLVGTYINTIGLFSDNPYSITSMSQNKNVIKPGFAIINLPHRNHEEVENCIVFVRSIRTYGSPDDLIGFTQFCECEFVNQKEGKASYGKNIVSFTNSNLIQLDIKPIRTKGLNSRRHVKNLAKHIMAKSFNKDDLLVIYVKTPNNSKKYRLEVYSKRSLDESKYKELSNN